MANKWLPDDVQMPSFMSKQATKMSFVPFAEGDDGIVLESLDIMNLCHHLHEVFGCRYWFIEHDKDKRENGEPVPRHFHIVFKFSSARRYVQIYREVTEFLKIPAFVQGESSMILNPRFSIGRFHDLNVALRYLMHLEEPPWKERYAPFDVFTNDKDRLHYAIANIDIDNLDPLLLETLIRDANGRRRKIIQALGVSVYARYRNVIDDIEEDITKEEMNLKYKQKPPFYKKS